jgi:ubiquinone/menaquinone biosynthesis C-methylase UbiE
LFECDYEFQVLDLGAGTRVLSALVAYSLLRPAVTLIDFASEILMRASERLAVSFVSS